MNRAITTSHKVISITDLTKTVFILRFERNNIEFQTGQHINVGPADSDYTREYSVYSGEKDDYLEILVKEVENGFISPLLRKVSSGDLVMVEEPMGYFYLPENLPAIHRCLFVATGTGIAPYHSFLKTHPDLNYHLIHGVTDASEACDITFYGSQNLTLCTSRKNDGNYHGRATQWLQENDLSNYQHIYLCGNRNMINDAFELLDKKKYPIKNIRAEAYF